MPLPSGRRSEGDAQRASTRRFSIVASIIFASIALLCYLPIGDNFFHAWHVNAQSWTKHFAFVPFAVALYLIYRSPNMAISEKAGASFWLLILGLVALGVGVSSGFVFDLK